MRIITPDTWLSKSNPTSSLSRNRTPRRRDAKKKIQIVFLQRLCIPPRLGVSAFVFGWFRKRPPITRFCFQNCRFPCQSPTSLLHSNVTILNQFRRRQHDPRQYDRNNSRDTRNEQRDPPHPTPGSAGPAVALGGIFRPATAEHEHHLLPAIYRRTSGDH